MKKTLLIALTVITIFVLNVQAFAFPIYNNSNNMTLDKQLYTPLRYVSRLADDTGLLYGDYGTYFPCSPYYKVGASALPLATIYYDSYVNTSVSSEIPAWLRELTHQIQLNIDTYTFPGLGQLRREQYINNFVFSRRDNYQTYDTVIVEMTYPRVYLKPDSLYKDYSDIIGTDEYNYSTFDFIVYSNALYQDMLSARFYVRYRVQDDNGIISVETYDEQFFFDSDPFTIPLYTIIDRVVADASSKGLELATYNEYICIESLQFVTSSIDGNVRTDQYDQADITYVDLQTQEQGLSRFSFVDFLTKTVGGFFGATLFEIGGVRVTFGTAFAVPFVFMILIAFLKKFSGG